MIGRPILMSAPMVRAILAGTKTQTRRIVKPQPCRDTAAAMLYVDDGLWHFGSYSLGGAWGECCPPARPRFAVGDCLWLRETWAMVRFSRDPESGICDDVRGRVGRDSHG